VEDVPKIVLKRLQQTARAEDHPDANLLTAFAEESLAESERARVVEHLAQCGDCREVVALAVPALETAAVLAAAPAAAAASRPSRKSWLNWPGLRWGVAAAGIVAIISIGIVQYKQREKSEATATNLVARNETAAPAAQPLALAPPATETQIAILPAEKEKRKESQAEGMKRVFPNHANNFTADKSARPVYPNSPKPQAMLGAGSGAGFGTGSGAGVRPAPTPRENSADVGSLRSATPEEAAKLAPNLSANKATVPSSSQTVVVEAQAAPVTSAPENQAADQIIENQTLQASQYKSSKAVGVVAAKDLATAQGASTLVLASPWWGISAEGSLQRSFDGGKTWVDVDVNSETATSGSKMAKSAAKTYAQESKKQTKAQPSAIFRALQAQGTEVWAGGSASMLYHSADSGAHWARVVPSADGATLTGDITRIEFSDPQHGQIATSSGEVWITADDGQTWRRQ
jgi:hypothetical protein